MAQNMFSNLFKMKQIFGLNFFMHYVTLAQVKATDYKHSSCYDGALT